MKVGIGLPTGISGATRQECLQWARQAEAFGFSSLSTIDRLVYGNWDPLIALAGAASVTERIRLTSTVVIVPNRANPTLLAKQAASLQELSRGRLSLGVGIGGRRDDYLASGVELDQRGRLMDEALAELENVWSGESRGTAGPVGPTPRIPPPLLVGGFSAAAYRRAARYGIGWVAAGGGPDVFKAGAERLKEAWVNAGREDEPRRVMIAFFGLGDDAVAKSERYLLDYYAFAGKSGEVSPGDSLAHVTAEQIASTALNTFEAIASTCEAFGAVGCDELILLPTNRDPGQVGLLAQALNESPGRYLVEG